MFWVVSKRNAPRTGHIRQGERPWPSSAVDQDLRFYSLPYYTPHRLGRKHNVVVA
jgi:hypothetical protein